MRIKSKAQDFRVTELLREGFLVPKGPYRVYRVTKEKLTSLEAAAELAHKAGVASGDVALAGLKDRQGVTSQYMTIHHGKPVFVRMPALRIEETGYAAEEITSSDSLGNAFEIILRGVTRVQRDELERGVREVLEHGVPNYFGDQRFGNVRHGQGWIARDLALGNYEKALGQLLAAPSEHDDQRMVRFHAALEREWGDWRACREIAGAFGAHHSVFEHLARNPGDFAGAFRYVKKELRLIHLYAFQSHLWNRAVGRWIAEALPRTQQHVVQGIEGPLFFPRGALAIPPEWKGKFPLPAEGLENVDDARQRDLLALALRLHDMQPGDLRIVGVPGFQLKGEQRPLMIQPRHLVVEDHARFPDRVRLKFDLPRGTYATMVLARLVPSIGVPRPPVLRERNAGARADLRENQRENERDRRTAPRPFAPHGGERPRNAGRPFDDRGPRNAGGSRARRPTDRAPERPASSHRKSSLGPARTPRPKKKRGGSRGENA